MIQGTLLFLEDDKDLQALVSTYLRERGYHVELARTVQEARDVLKYTQVDAAIVDGLLPGMTGADFIQELRRTEPSLPILFASAFWRDLKSHDLLTRQLTLLGSTADSAREILSRTAQELAQLDFEGDQGERFQVTFSAGIAVAPQDGTHAEALLQRADERLYRAKANGRNRIEL